MKIILTRQKEIEIELDENGKPIEPKCPMCKVGVIRPKCVFELDPSQCPRHDLKEAYLKALRETGHSHYLSGRLKR